MTKSIDSTPSRVILGGALQELVEKQYFQISPDFKKATPEENSIHGKKNPRESRFNLQEEMLHIRITEGYSFNHFDPVVSYFWSDAVI